MVLASFLFATMGVCVKLASTHYGSGEIVFYRGLTGALIIAAFSRWRGGSLRTPVPAMHFWRSLTGVTALCLWFYAIAGLPLATAMTLNYMSSVWMALFLVGGAVVLGSSRVDGRLVGAVLLGFAGVGLILQPTIEQNQWWYGLVGLLSGMVSAGAFGYGVLLFDDSVTGPALAGMALIAGAGLAATSLRSVAPTKS